MPSLSDQLVELLTTSEFSKLLPAEEVEVLKNIYKDAEPQKIQQVIDQIKNFEQALEEDRQQQEEKANKAAEALSRALQELHQQHLRELKNKEKLSQSQEKAILQSLERDLTTTNK